MANTRVIATAGIIAVGVGSVNSIAKDKRLPSARFLIGSGVAFLILSALAEAEPEVANALAVAVVVTVVIGDGGGVLSYINTGEMDTQKKKKSTNKTPAVAPGEHAEQSPYAHGDPSRGAILSPHPYVFPNMPVTSR